MANYESKGGFPTHPWNIPREKRPYVALFRDKRAEIWATTLLDAKEEAIKLLKVPKTKTGLLSVILADVTHDTGSL